MATEKTLDVQGMDCAGCENRVQTALKRLGGRDQGGKERIRAGGYEVA